jgi:hypothetical protein
MFMQADIEANKGEGKCYAVDQVLSCRLSIAAIRVPA